jgi:hypothetical protein
VLYFRGMIIEDSNVYNCWSLYVNEGDYKRPRSLNCAMKQIEGIHVDYLGFKSDQPQSCYLGSKLLPIRKPLSACDCKLSI